MSDKNTMTAKARIDALLDPNSFVEIGAFVTKRNTDFNMDEQTVPADGVITGYGTMNSELVYVYSQEASAMKGSVGEMHARKIAKTYDLAVKVGAPIIGLIDCAGLRIQEAMDAVAGFGEIYMSQVKASGVIPQITAVLGSCGGGVAISSVLSDFTFMDEENGKVFVNSPNALAGNRIDKCDTSNAAFQSEAGVVDFVCKTQGDVMVQIRELVSYLPENNENDACVEMGNDDLNRLVAGFEEITSDAAKALTQVADEGRFIEVKKNYATDMVTGLMALDGITVGAVANQGDELSTAGCLKAESFVKFCDAFGIPVITFTNVNGYKAGMDEEKTIAVAAAKLTYAFASATVPKINVITKQAYGTSYLTMNSKHIGADIVFALTDAKVGIMEAKAACQVLFEQEIADAADTKKALDEKVKEFESEKSSVAVAAKRGYIDSVIEAQDIRKNLIYAVEMLYTKNDGKAWKKHGTV